MNLRQEIFMKRFHVHVAVSDLSESVRFYSAIFAAEPSVLKDDYAKWMLEDPRINFAISSRGQIPGVDHLGLQVEDDAQLHAMRQQLSDADRSLLERGAQPCCYAKSDKYWITDPQGVAWETFHTLESIPVFGEDNKPVAMPSECCIPLAQRTRKTTQDTAASCVPVTVYHNPSCGTSRNVLALVRNAGIEPTVIEYLQHPPDRPTLQELLRQMQIPPRALLREKGTPYAQLGLSATHWTDEELIDQMLAHPILINRPIVITPWGVKLCRPSELVLDILPLPQPGPFLKEDGAPLIDADGRRVP